MSNGVIVQLSLLYMQKIVRSEADIGRALVAKEGIFWDHEQCAGAETMRISVQSDYWDPRPPIKSRQVWDSELRKLTQVGTKVY